MNAERGRQAVGLAAKTAKASRRPHQPITVVASKHGYITHVDAAFDDEENAAFVLGIKVTARSTWIDAAQWDEGNSVLTLTIDGKEYTFPGVDYTGAVVFSRYNSKGKWYWEQWRSKSGENEFLPLEPAYKPMFRLPNRRR